MDTDFFDEYSDWSGCEDSDCEDDLILAVDKDVPPFLNPPVNYALLASKYDSLEALMEDLHEFCTSARFSVIKQRSNNYVKGFRPTRVNLICARGMIWKQEAFSRNTSTVKVGCP